MLNNIRVKMTQTGVITQSPVTLQPNSTVTIVGPNRLDTLYDVVATGEIDNGIPVYDASLDKYVIKQLYANLITGAVDGGLF
jgi:hypothetical protein